MRPELQPLAFLDACRGRNNGGETAMRPEPQFLAFLDAC